MKTKNKFMGGLYVLLYAFLVWLPIVILLMGPKFKSRPPLLDQSVTLAFIGLALMALQFALSARFKVLNNPFGTDLVYIFHRMSGIAAFLLIFSHPILLFIQDTRYLRYLTFINQPLRAQMGVIALLLLILVVWMAEWRQQLKIPYTFWKIVHGIAATIVIPLAGYHVLVAGNYMDMPWKQIIWVGYILLFTLTILYTRVFYPLRLMRYPFKVKRVNQERGNVWTLQMEPAGGSLFAFSPGQFGWLTAWHTPFSDTEHPFSLASSAENRDYVEMSIKNQGPFTSTIQNLKPGHKIYLDAPYGYFSIDRFPDADRFILIPGGIGVTPIMSTLRTMADRGDKRPILLFYANLEWDTVTFREEVEELEKRLNMKVVYIIERPGEDWPGESGFLNAAILDKYLDDGWIKEGTEIFLCGPALMTNAVEKALIKVGYPEKKIHTEKFALV